MKCAIDLLGKTSEEAERGVRLQYESEHCEGERAGVAEPRKAEKNRG